jgi:hypothetical protein
MTMVFGIIYGATNKINGKRYVGQTIKLLALAKSSKGQPLQIS